MIALRLPNILFLLAAVVIGPLLLLTLMVHGIILDRIHRMRVRSNSPGRQSRLHPE